MSAISTEALQTKFCFSNIDMTIFSAAFYLFIYVTVFRIYKVPVKNIFLKCLLDIHKMFCNTFVAVSINLYHRMNSFRISFG